MKLRHTGKKLLSLFCSLMIVASSIIGTAMTASAAPASNIPENMLNSYILQSLEYTGYKVQAQKDNGTIFQNSQYGPYANAAQYLSAIRTYAYVSTGAETTGGKPNISYFQANGMCCGSFAAYYFFNYLPNVAGVSTQGLTDLKAAVDAQPTNYQSAKTWDLAVQSMVASGKATMRTSVANPDYSTLQVGDIITFSSEAALYSHVAVYAGTYNGKHFIIHVGNSRGPEINTIEGMIADSKVASFKAAYAVAGIPPWQENGAIIVNKTVAGTGTKLSGAEFEAKSNDTNEIFSIGPTDGNGYAITDDEIPYGTYTVTETVFPDGYESNGQTSWTVTVSAASPVVNGTHTETLNITNKLSVGELQVKKADESKNPLSGVTYGLYGSEADATADTNRLATQITNDQGETIFTDLVPGTYYVKELLAKDETYVLDKTVYHATVTPNFTACVNNYAPIVNKQKYWNLTVTKRDIVTGTTAAGDATLAGAVYGLYKDGALLKQYTTGADGTFVTDEYLAGTGYTLKEITPSTGYWLDETIYDLDSLTAADKLSAELTQLETSVGEEVVTNHLSMIKFTNNGDDLNNFNLAEKGAKFQVYLKSAGSYEAAVATGDYRLYDNGVADETGNVIWSNGKRVGGGNTISKELAYGTYTVHQVSGWEGRKLIDDFDVEIKDFETFHHFILKNPIYTMTLHVNKTDAETGELIVDTNTSAKFKIWSYDLQKYMTYSTVYPVEQTIDTFTTTGGKFTLPMKLVYGSYRLEEVEGPQGYVGLAKIDFKVDGSKDEDTVVVPNTPNEWVIHKADLSDTAIGVPGATYRVTYPDGSAQDYTTDATGNITLKRLPQGQYSYVEVDAPDGYFIDPTTHYFTVAADNTVNGEKNVADEPIPMIGTTAAVNGEKEINATEVFTLTDVVSYSRLIAGKEYTVSGVLMDKTTGNALLVNGKEVTGTATFTPKNSTGEVTVEFTFDSRYIKQDTQLVAFETLSRDGVELTVHADIEDKDQTVTVHVPVIGTTATINGEKEVNATEIFTLSDTVAYKNLTPGKEYTVNGVLMDKTTGEPLVIQGKKVTGITTFTPENSTGEVTVEFTLDSRYIKQDTQLVAFETLSRDGVELTAHADIEDKDQTVTVHVPVIGTIATSDEKKEVTSTGTVTINDVVSYKNLTPGKEYTVEGILMDKTTGKALIAYGTDVRAGTTFTPEASEGEVTVTFVFRTFGLTGDLDVVAFETLYRESVELVAHTDIDDGDQTVIVHTPDIGTTATVGGKHEVTTTGSITIDDVVSYTNLIPGQEYTVKGILMNKATGKALLIGGKEVTAEATFTPDKANGSITVSFTFDASGLVSGTKIVAFETLYQEDTELVVHADIDDADQTVTANHPPVTDIPSTGGSAVEGFFVYLFAGALFLLGCWMIGKGFLIRAQLRKNRRS